MDGQHQAHAHADHNPNIFKQKFWISLLLTLATLLFSSSVQGWFGVNWAFSGSQFVPAFFGVIVFFYGGLVFIKGAASELSQKRPGMMTLISMAIIVAFIYSLAVTFGAIEGMDFWWELTTLVTIMLLGHWLEMTSIGRAEGALGELAKLLPDTAELVQKSGVRTVATSELKVDDQVLVRPGSHIPADGVVVKGDSDVNESMLTGESKPVQKSPKAQVIGGTINGSGPLTVRVTKIGDDTALAGIMRLVAEAQHSKSHTQILADKAAFYLVFIALGTAFLTGILWFVAGQSVGFILERVVTVLVIACPHALGLAVPLVTAISTTLGAKHGLLIRKRAALEAARNVDVVLFDKTGTLTEGALGVVDVITDMSKNEVLALAAAAEAESEHHLARAIVKYTQALGLKIGHTQNVRALAGRGVMASLGGKSVHVGGLQLLTELHITQPEYLTEPAKLVAKDGKTVVYVVLEHKVCGAIMLADVIRPESKQAATDLQQMGKRVAILTGDSQGVAAWTARELGVTDYFANILPEHKAQVVKKLQASGARVAMVGDGVNDAPALAQADIGIAIGAGTDVAVESAGIILASNDPRGVLKIVKLSSATYRKMLQNLAWAAGYNIVALPLAAGVFGFVLSPAMGAVLMSISTIVVAVNAQFLRKLKM